MKRKTRKSSKDNQQAAQSRDLSERRVEPVDDSVEINRKNQSKRGPKGKLQPAKETEKVQFDIEEQNVEPEVEIIANTENDKKGMMVEPEGKPLEKNSIRLSEVIQITFPYECKNILRQAKLQAFIFIKQIVDELEREISPQNLDDLEKMRKIFRRLKAFTKEIFSKVEEIAFFEKFYETTKEVKIAEIDETLHTENTRLFNSLNDLLEKISTKRNLLEYSFAREIEVQLESTLTVSELEEKDDFKIKCKNSAIFFDAFLEKYIQTQKDYFNTVQECAKLLDSNFDNLKIEAIKKFKKITKRHTDIDALAKLEFCNLSFAEEILLE